MTTISHRSVRTGIVTAASAVLLATALPATASADQVDDMLDKLPSGQITCEQAGKYWTSEAEYNSIRAQAQAVAIFHPRGDEIRDALARVEDAADRCNLRGDGQAPVEAPAEDDPTQPEPAEPEPSPPNPDTPDSNEDDRDNQTPTPDEDTTPGKNDTENAQDDRDRDYDEYETPTLGSSDILLLLGLLAGSGSSR